uniref:WD repeat-containing protein 52 n=2 Tax=Schizaphis graminum TaxID=13262 RepID=A0A2S2P1G3_SCHGA
MAANAKPLRRLAKFHGGVITSLQPSPIGYFIATTSLDGWIHIHDVTNKKLIFTHNFKVPITSSIWLPLQIASSGDIFVIGFQNGILKIVAAPLKKCIEEKILNLSEIVEIQSSKPHTNAVRHLSINPSAKTLISGSDDNTIFVYKIKTEPIKLSPIGMFPLPGKVTFIHWKPSEKQMVLISCDTGHIIEVKVPASRPSYTTESFLLKLESRVIQTMSIKSELQRQQYFFDLEYKKKEKINKKMEKLKNIREKNPDLEINEMLDFEDSEEGEEPPRIFIPSLPNPVLFAIYTPSEKGIWVSIDGYDAGYLYEYDFNTSKPVTNAHIIIPYKNNIPLTAITMFGTDPLTILMGFADGRIRLTNVQVKDVSDFGDYIEYSIHDNIKGRVNMLCFSHDNCMLYTCGDDGNIFSFMFQCNNKVIEKCMSSISKFPQPPVWAEENILTSKEDLKLSLEERKIHKENLKALNLSNKEKDKTNCLLKELRDKFKQVIVCNKSLPEPLQLTDDYFQLDERINNSLIEEARSEMDKLHSRLAFDYEKSSLGLKYLKNYFTDPIITNTFAVKAILRDVVVKTLYHEMRHNLFNSLVEEFVSKKLKFPKQSLEEIKVPNSVRRRGSTVLNKGTHNQIHNVSESEIFLRNVLEEYPSLPKKIQSAIDRFATRRNFENQEILKILNMYNNKPDNNTIEEEALLDNAWNTIGYMNLKTGSDFKLTENEIVTMEDKFEQYINVKKEAYNLKTTFNEKVLGLRQRKISLIHDYKQFKYDVCMIQKELNDPEIMTASNFPEVVLDEFIDPSLIDPFEPIVHWDPTNLIVKPEKSHIMHKNAIFDELTNLEITMQSMRKEQLKYRHMCLHETMLTKINMFDDDLMELDKMRKDVKLRIKFLDLLSLTFEEELIILNDFDLAEDKYLQSVCLKISLQNDKVNQIQNIQEEIKHLNDIINNKSNMLIDIQHTFDMEIRNDGFAKYLKKIFKKKLKIPKLKSDDAEDTLSSSSSGGSDESDSEFINEGAESFTAMNRVTVFDEKVLPLGCDPKLLNITFELRSKRYEIEKIIEDNNKKIDVLNTRLSLTYEEFDAIENELKQNINELEAYRIKKQLKLNDVKTTIVLNKSQMTKAKLLKSCIVLYGNVMQDLTNRVIELKKEKKEIVYTFKNEKLVAKQFRTEITKMENILKSYKIAIKDEMIKKFKIETDWNFLDEMEMTIINYMIINSKSKAKDTKECLLREIKLLENKISSQTESIIDLLKWNTYKIKILKDVCGNINKIRQCLMDQKKINVKLQNLTLESSFTTELTTIKRTYDTLLKQKQDISEKIIMYKCKGKMFPPIVKQSCTKATPSQAINDQSLVTTPTLQEESEESWTINDEQLTYNMEFNVEPKISNLSKQSLSRLTKQLSNYDSFENIDEVYGTNKWVTYYDDEVIPPATETVGDVTTQYNAFSEMIESDNSLSDDNKFNGSHNNIHGDNEPKNVHK